jgi:hypothetical protein
LPHGSVARAGCLRETWLSNDAAAVDFADLGVSPKELFQYYRDVVDPALEEWPTDMAWG